MDWRNRIVGYDEADPKQLLANEANWRTHPMYQREVIKGVLDEIGWLQDIIVNKRTVQGWAKSEAGIDTVLDGHLRVLLALEKDQKKVPVKYVDLTPEEEAAALLILDPSSTLAKADSDRLRELLEKVDPLNEAMSEMLSELAEQYHIDFSDEAKLLDDDTFADFSEYGIDNDGRVSFKFGDYTAKVDEDTYAIFQKRVHDIRSNKTGLVEIGDVLREILSNGSKS